MTMLKLNSKVSRYAKHLDEDANYSFSGHINDGGRGKLIEKLNRFKEGLIRKHDLRPSEFTEKFWPLEVGEPLEFSEVFENE